MNLLDLAPYVTPYVTGCPDPMIVQALRQAAREFSEYTRDYRETLSVTLAADTATYDVGAMVSEGAMFLRIERVIRNSDGEPVTPFKAADYDVDRPGWEIETGPAVCSYTLADPVGVVRVYPIPDDDIDDTLSVTVSLMPTISASTILDRFGNQHAEYLGYGAAGILMLQPQKPWSNPQGGAFYAGKFAERMSQVRNRVLRDHTTATSHVSVGGLENY